MSFFSPRNLKALPKWKRAIILTGWFLEWSWEDVKEWWRR